MKNSLLITTVSLGVFLILYQILTTNTDFYVTVMVMIAALAVSLVMAIVGLIGSFAPTPTSLAAESSATATYSVAMVALSWEIFFSSSLFSVIAFLVGLLFIYVTVVKSLKMNALYQYPKWKTVLTVVMFLAIIWGGIATRIFLF